MIKKTLLIDYKSIIINNLINIEKEHYLLKICKINCHLKNVNNKCIHYNFNPIDNLLFNKKFKEYIDKIKNNYDIYIIIKYSSDADNEFYQILMKTIEKKLNIKIKGYYNLNSSYFSLHPNNYIEDIKKILNIKDKKVYYIGDKSNLIDNNNCIVLNNINLNNYIYNYYNYQYDIIDKLINYYNIPSEFIYSDIIYNFCNDYRNRVIISKNPNDQIYLLQKLIIERENYLLLNKFKDIIL